MERSFIRRHAWHIAAAVLAIPVVLIAVAAISVWRSMSVELAKSKSFCAGYAEGAAADVEDIKAKATQAGLEVSVRPMEGGAHIEARTGVLTTTFSCELEVKARRLTLVRHVQGR